MDWWNEIGVYMLDSSLHGVERNVDFRVGEYPDGDSEWIRKKKWQWTDTLIKVHIYTWTKNLKLQKLRGWFAINSLGYWNLWVKACPFLSCWSVQDSKVVKFAYLILTLVKIFRFWPIKLLINLIIIIIHQFNKQLGNQNNQVISFDISFHVWPIEVLSKHF